MERWSEEERKRIQALGIPTDDQGNIHNVDKLILVFGDIAGDVKSRETVEYTVNTFNIMFEDETYKLVSVYFAKNGQKSRERAKVFGICPAPWLNERDEEAEYMACKIGEFYRKYMLTEWTRIFAPV